jgi:hypothetical protein
MCNHHINEDLISFLFACRVYVYGAEPVSLVILHWEERKNGSECICMSVRVYIFETRESVKAVKKIYTTNRSLFTFFFLYFIFLLKLLRLSYVSLSIFFSLFFLFLLQFCLQGKRKTEVKNKHRIFSFYPCLYTNIFKDS